jgi:Fur family peroxide stress response transcriptional regulator
MVTNYELNTVRERGAMINSKQVDKELLEAIEICRRHGIKATHQRTEILREMVSSQEHPDAETVYRSVRKRMPSISLDTVYRTLRLFEEKGVIVKMGAITDRARFDANTTRHHHFVCTQCGLVRDFYYESFNCLQAPSAVSDMGNVDSVYVELRGVCSACNAQNRKKGNK